VSEIYSFPSFNIKLLLGLLANDIIDPTHGLDRARRTTYYLYLYIKTAKVYFLYPY